MRISFVSAGLPKQGAVAVAASEKAALSPSARALDEATGGTVTRAIKHSRFTGKKAELLEILAPAGLENSRIVVFGLGDPRALQDVDLENLGGALTARLDAAGERAVTVCLDDLAGEAGRVQRWAALLAAGARLRSYRFDKYKTKQAPEKKPSLDKLSVAVAKPNDAKAQFAILDKVVDGVFTTRDIVSEPANIVYPESFVEEARKLEKLGVEVKALDVKAMKKLGMGALLGVGQGSAHESRLLVLVWRGATPAPAKGKAKAKGASAESVPLAIVGKGVCFDTGGISLKPAANMEDMKWDMGGAGVVLGVMHALAARKAKADVVGICGLVENMPDGAAQRPGDIVTSMSGQTIEVLNTDAEGRLVLADALWYAQTTFAPKAIVDLATLTGAIMVALGKVHAGLFANDDPLAERLSAAGKAVGEPLWRLPMGKDYDEMLDSDAADMKNIGNRWGGSITAAQFLQRFIKEGTAWAHLDIAGVTWADKDKPTVPKGATAFGVRLLDRLVAEHYEG